MFKLERGNTKLRRKWETGARAYVCEIELAV
jgi:hypothetical protein